MLPITEIGGRRLPFLRWSFLRAALGLKTLSQTRQVGDGREAALRDYVLTRAAPGDLDDTIRVVDEFCLKRKFIMNVGDAKGAILEEAVRRVAPRLVLDLGTYCGYAALRIARAMPADCSIVALESNASNAAIAEAIWQHAGIADRATVVVGSLGDGWTAEAALGFRHGEVDLVYVAHDRDSYVAHVEQIVHRAWLHNGSIVITDHLRLPGARAYLTWMRWQEGRSFNTVEHPALLEYQSLVRDLVLESEYVGAGRAA